MRLLSAHVVAAVVLSLLSTVLSVAPPVPPSSDLEQVPAGVRDSVVRLYHAVFDRDPDPGGLEFWSLQYDNGMDLRDVAGAFIVSPEWTATYGEVDDAAFVELLYANVLDRTPDDGGRDFWEGRLEAGETRVRVLLGFSESPEFVAATGTAAPVQPTAKAPPVPAGSGEGRRIVYSDSQQRVWLVEADESIADTYLVSGRRLTPAAGTYRVYSKSPTAWAGHDGIVMQHMVRFAHGRSLAIGFHSIPRYGSGGRPLQTEAQLGTYQSSGCVRQADHKAAALYEWAPIGTVVVVVP